MRVLQFCRAFSPLSETFIYDYVTELERQGVENHVVTLDRQNLDSRPFANVRVVEEPGRWELERLWARGLVALNLREIDEVCWPTMRRRLQHVARAVSPDIIHAHFGPQGVLVAPVASRLRIPLVVTFYGFDVSRLIQKDFWVRQYQVELLARHVHTVGISRHVCDKLKTLGFEDVSLCHLGVRREQFGRVNAQCNSSVDEVRCLHVGRLVEKKSPVMLIRAFKEAVVRTAGQVRLRLDIVGDGPLRQEASAEVERLGLTDSIRLHGAVEHEQVIELLRGAHIYTQHCITASDGDQEGQGVSFVEAAACGIPVVATRHNGIPDVVLDGESGYLVEEGDFLAMGAKIAILAQDAGLRTRMGRNGYAHVQENMDAAKQARKAKAIYLSAMEMASLGHNDNVV